MAVVIITKSKEKYIVVENYAGSRTFSECVDIMIDFLYESKTEK